jgi:hypothetical protein
MVSPLTIWQHPQPKYLWPVLGGLSVLAHVGVLGMSLPYMLTLMQSSGSVASSSTIPIELVSGEDLAQTTSDFSTDREARDEQAESEPVEAASQSDVAVNSEDSSLEASISDAELDVAEPLSSRPTMSEYNNNQTENSPRDSNSPENQQTSQGSSSPAIPENQSSEPANSGDIPSIDATGNPLAEPGATSGGSAGTDQVTSLTIVGSLEVPTQLQRDVADTPPKLISDLSTTSWRPQSLGCGRVDFFQSTGTYKMTVNADGSLNQVTPWTDGIERALTESESAIACLLESADLRFEPALLEGQPVFNDNLLLTVEIIELQAE